MDDKSKLIEIYSGTPWQAGMVNTLLEDAGIDAFVADEIMGTYNPWWTSAGGAGPVRVMISETNREEAGKIVEAYEKNLDD